MHQKLKDIRIKYKDSDTLNNENLKRYLEAKNIKK